VVDGREVRWREPCGTSSGPKFIQRSALQEPLLEEKWFPSRATGQWERLVISKASPASQFDRSRARRR